MKGKQHLILSAPIYVLVVRYLSCQETLLSPFLFLFIAVTMIGSLYPDIDLKFGLGRHRSPITHSLLLPFLLFAIFPDGNLGAQAFQAFTIGVASHLLGDNIRTGNLVGVPKRWEKWWYWMNGIVCLMLLGLSNFFSFEVLF